MSRIRTENLVPATLTVHQVAERLSVSARTVWSWISDGRLRAIRLSARTTRIPIEALDQFLRSCPERDSRGAGRKA
jgi:excisionase family DNA binding protein